MRSLNAFEEKIVVTVIELEFVCQTSTVFCCGCLFSQESTCALLCCALSN